MKKIFCYAIMMMALSVGTLGLTACGGGDLFDALMEEDEDVNEYWGKSFALLSGVWVLEGHESDPEADYLYVDNTRACFVTCGRLAYSNFMKIGYGLFSYMYGTVNLIHFNDFKGVNQDRYMEWVDDSHQRLRIYQDKGHTEPADVRNATVWVKVNEVPSAYGYQIEEANRVIDEYWKKKKGADIVIGI